MKFQLEQRVQKIGGSYQASGTIKAAWIADDGLPRYVFRFDEPNGMLHIFNEGQLNVIEDVCSTHGDDYEYKLNQWWVKELEAIWVGDGQVTEDMKRAAKIALDVLSFTLPTTKSSAKDNRLKALADARDMFCVGSVSWNLLNEKIEAEKEAQPND